MCRSLMILIALVTLLPLTGCGDPQLASATPPAAASAPAPAAPLPAPPAKPDGWAGSAGAPASPGGAAAPAATVYEVSTRGGLLNALNAGSATPSDQPKTIYVSGMIDLCSDATGAHLEAVDFLSQAGYGAAYPTYAAYRDAYVASCAAATVAVPNPAPGLAGVQVAAAKKQKAAIVVPVGANTTIMGRGSGAGFKNGSLAISGKTNVVIRNVAILDAYDYFPVWDPTDSNGGMFNSAYDAVSITNGASYVWIDHCRLGDGDRPDSTLSWHAIPGVAATKEWVSHDGLIDVTNGASFVTLSWNRLEDHNKTMLFGSSDGSTVDAGKLKITLHHNHFVGLTQRLPRVRFGQVHLYNNLYEAIGSYAVGVGVQARIYSEANDFTGTAHAFDKYDNASGEGYFCDIGSLSLGGTEPMATAALVAWNPADFYAYAVDAATVVRTKVTAGAGVGKL